MPRPTRVLAISLCIIMGLAGSALAGGHTWAVNELFSNADGTIQFVELKETQNGGGETGTAGHNVTSNTRSFTIEHNRIPPTNLKHILLATPAFVGLPGAPTPDYVIPAGSVPFFDRTGAETIRYIPYCTFNLSAGTLPIDGVNSLTITTHEAHAFAIGTNSPTNYAGDAGSINVTVSVEDGKPTLDLRFPNPVVGQLLVNYSVPVTERAVLAVFDVNGRSVAALRLAPSRTGWHTAQFGRFPAGVYSVRLTQNGRRVTSQFTTIR